MLDAGFMSYGLFYIIRPTSNRFFLLVFVADIVVVCVTSILVQCVINLLLKQNEYILLCFVYYVGAITVLLFFVFLPGRMF